MKIAICLLVIALLLLWHKSKRVEQDFYAASNSYCEQIEKQRKQIIALQKETDSSKIQLTSYIQNIADLEKQLSEANRKADFYKNIIEDSGNLNDQEPNKNVTIEKNGENVLDTEQALVFEAIENSNNNFFISGKAGTGKSFLLDFFRKATKKHHIVLAPTGIAALNVSGATLHSTFGYNNLVNLNINDISPDTIQLKSEQQLILENVSTIIIDEISMVRADTFEKINRLLQVINDNDLPFGGKQLLLFGDLFQLPPVTKTQEKVFLTDQFGGVYFFCSDSYKKGNFRFLELTINHRQKDDSNYFSLLNRIREGRATDSDIKVLNSRVVRDESIYDRFTTLLPTKSDVAALNKLHIDQLDSDEYIYHAKIILNKYPNNTPNLDSIFPLVSPLCLKKGALVMMVANDPEHRWVNGTLGIVSNLSPLGISVAINKRTYDIVPHDFKEQEVSYKNGKITYETILKVQQYPIVPAYAMTIHKSQGQTYQNIVCDIASCFANGQAYVALSRCASLNGLHLKSPITNASIRVDKSVLNFYHDQLNSSPDWR